MQQMGPRDDAQQVRDVLRELAAHVGPVLETLSEVILLYSADGHLRWASPSLRTTFGYDVEAVTGTRFVLEHPDDEERVTRELLARIDAGEQVVEIRGRARCGDGSVKWAASRTRVVRDADGGMRYVVVAVRDVTEQQEASDALVASEAHFRMIADNSSDVVLHTGPTGRIDWASPSSLPILGYHPDELVGRRVPDLMHPDDLGTVVAVLRDAMESGQDSGRIEARFRAADGTWRWMSNSGRAIRADDGTVVGGIDSLRDMSVEHAMSEELERRARLDPLTELPNRRELLDRLAAVLAHEPRAGTSSAVLFLDLDRLKSLNDEHGHAAGDAVLVEVGRRIRGALRADDVVGRFAGDEFVVVLPSLARPDDAWHVADTIHERIARPVLLDDVTLRVSVSIGLTLARPGDDPEAVLRRADVALYRAKLAGRARTEADVSDAPSDGLPNPHESFSGDAETLAHDA